MCIMRIVLISILFSPPYIILTYKLTIKRKNKLCKRTADVAGFFLITTNWSRTSIKRPSAAQTIAYIGKCTSVY